MYLDFFWLYFLTWAFSDCTFWHNLFSLCFLTWPDLFSDLNLFFTVISTVYFLTWTSRQPGASISEPPAEADNVSLQMVQHCRWNDRQTPLPQNLLQLVPHFIGSHQIHQVAEVYLQPHLPNSIASAFLICIGIGPPLPQLIAALTFYFVVAYSGVWLAVFQHVLHNECLQVKAHWSPTFHGICKTITWNIFRQKLQSLKSYYCSTVTTIGALR